MNTGPSRAANRGKADAARRQRYKRLGSTPSRLRNIRNAGTRLRGCQHQSLLVRARIFSPSFDRRDDLDTAHRGVTILRLVTLSYGNPPIRKAVNVGWIRKSGLQWGMFYALCHLVDSFVGVGKNARRNRLRVPPAGGALRTAQQPKTSRLQIGVEGPSVRKRTLAYCTQCEGSDSASQLFVGISPLACISRNVIPRVRPRVCCVQYATLNRYIACNINCIP